ncbi:hypothetical protein HRUBRA_01051 [Pseudohaliea rubra DSM 19751]|uniref:Uncharacterized protein n=1 Tax=Pseudohaliea rubra DSM 19751 TaxID=1265313 RepID=A0A095VSL7_9GAMM|nr:hypothetical protein HRUBRA_01051 [Pseudohaliea rubra DSM 19751]
MRGDMSVSEALEQLLECHIAQVFLCIGGWEYQRCRIIGVGQLALSL